MGLKWVGLARCFAHCGIELFSTYVLRTHLLASRLEAIFPKNIGVELVEEVVLIRGVFSAVAAAVLSELIVFVAIAGLEPSMLTDSLRRPRSTTLDQPFVQAEHALLL